jgi:membrane-bound lytic murein transglycosylase B
VRSASHPLRRALTALAVASVLGPLAPAAAQTAPPTPPPAAPPAAAGGATDAGTELDGDVATISPELAAVAVDGVEYRAAQADFDATSAALDEVRSLRANAESELSTLATREAQLTEDIARDTERKKLITLELGKLRAALRDLAVLSYVRGDTTVSRTTDPNELTARAGEQIVFASVGEDKQASKVETEARLAEVVAAINRANAERDEVRRRTVEVTQARDNAVSDEARLGAELVERQTALEQARATAFVEGVDFPLVALDAYWRAARALAAEQPACGVPWWALAGITKVESRHGSFRGSALEPDGDTTQRIIGIALDGNNNTAVIRDSDGGNLDGDTVYDRAVGPMQFIPSTWRRWQRDGNGDGVPDPHNLYDVALAAADYLCASGPLTDDTGLSRGFFSYNHSNAYVASVLGWAHQYAATLAL